MRMLLPIAALFVMSAGAAKAGPQFGQFGRLCLQQRADAASVLAAAESEGWSQVPADDRGRAGRAKLVDGSTLTMRVEEKTAPSGRPSLICTVISRPADPDLFKSAGQWAKVDPMAATATSATFTFFEEDDGSHTPIYLAKGKIAAAPTNRTHFVGVRSENDESTVFTAYSIEKSPK